MTKNILKKYGFITVPNVIEAAGTSVIQDIDGRYIIDYTFLNTLVKVQGSPAYGLGSHEAVNYVSIPNLSQLITPVFSSSQYSTNFQDVLN